MEMQQIRYFLALARTLSFARAAEECNVSASAMTRAIQALESELGGELLRREHSGSHLTELGKRMLPLLERCYESAASAKALARSLSSDECLPLPLAVSHSVNVELLMSPIAELFRALPGLQLRLFHGDGDAVLDLLKRGDAVLGVAGPLPNAHERLERWALFDEPFELAVRDDHPLARDNEVTLGKLREAALFVQRGCEMREAALRQLAAEGLSPGRAHEAETLDALGALVANGLGAALVPRSAPQAESVRRVPVADLSLARTVYAYAIAGRRRDAAATAFLNLLRSGVLDDPA